MQSRSIVFTGGLVIDGTGRDRFLSDLEVVNGTIRLIPAGEGNRVGSVDISGLVIAPGFIDTHSHADVESLLGDDQVHASRITQGVTTEIVGNCGISPFPVVQDRHGVASQFMNIVFGPQARAFADLEEFDRAVGEAGLASNIAPLVGHGTLRASIMGYENRHASPSELEEMRDALFQAMAEGAFGLSTGLCYTPATYAPPEEVVTLAAVVAEFGGLYATHIRNETDLVRESLEEAIAVSRATGVDLHISHLKAAGRAQWGTSGQILGLLERVREEGVDVTADVYPYTAASTSLHSLLPPWTAEGGMDALYSKLGDPECRARIDRDLNEGVPGWQNLGSAAGWDNVRLATSAKTPEWEGLSIAALASDGERPIDTIARVLRVNKGKVVVVIEAMDHSDMVAFLTWAHAVVGSDGIPLPGKPHPRLTGTFPRVLGRYRDHLGTTEEAVHRMTGASARRFRLHDRGTIADGQIADLVVFDPEAVKDGSTYEDPWLHPDGIRHVLVGGEVAVWDSETRDLSAGALLRRGGRSGPRGFRTRR